MFVTAMGRRTAHPTTSSFDRILSAPIGADAGGLPHPHQSPAFVVETGLSQREQYSAILPNGLVASNGKIDAEPKLVALYDAAFSFLRRGIDELEVLAPPTS